MLDIDTGFLAERDFGFDWLLSSDGAGFAQYAGTGGSHLFVHRAPASITDKAGWRDSGYSIAVRAQRTAHPDLASDVAGLNQQAEVEGNSHDQYMASATATDIGGDRRVASARDRR